MVFRVLHRLTGTDNSAEYVARRATNEEMFGPSADDLQSLAILVRKPKSSIKVFAILEQRLVQRSKYWRRKSKTLTVLQYFLMNDNKDALDWMQSNESLIESLLSFKYIDSSNNDQGRSVREKAKGLLSVINDPARLEEAKQNYRTQREDVRLSIGTGRPSTASRNTLEMYRETLFDDPDPTGINDVFHQTNQPSTRISVDTTRYHGMTLGALDVIQEEH